jgi:hypothetical protein
VDQLSEFLKSKDIPYVQDDQFVFTCGFVFYPFRESLACNNPKGSQFLDLSMDDAERLIKRQIRKVPLSLHKPFWKH